MRSKVVVLRCVDYENDSVEAAVKEGVRLLGGVGAFVGKGEKILLKPNLLAAVAPEKGVTSHPAVFRAIGKAFQDRGAKLYYGDSPAKGNIEETARVTGIKRVADELGIPMADFRNSRKISFPKAIIAKKLLLTNGALDADGIISICKMKTHALTRITGAIKNQFGCVPGRRKQEYHFMMPDIANFSSLIVDITRFLKPRLYIMDGIIAMEGNGPHGGELKKMNVLLFSADPVALDATFCRLIALNPEFVPKITIAQKSNLGTYKMDEIELSGDNIEKLVQKDFDVKRKPYRQLTLARACPFLFNNFILPRPVIDPSKCSGCDSCISQCPVSPRAIYRDNKNPDSPPRYNYDKCIRCYCCQEICPEKAISVKIPFMGKFIYK